MPFSFPAASFVDAAYVFGSAVSGLSGVDVAGALGSSAGAVSFLHPDRTNPSPMRTDNRIQLALRRDAFMARSLTFFAKY